jgi:hypothetical protein
MATGSRDMAEPLSGAFSVGAYAEYNQFGAKRQVAWQAEALLSDADYGEISTEISSAGLYGVFSTDVTDVRVALGSITGGEGRFAGNQRNPGNVFKMSDPTGVHASLGVHTDVMTIGQGILRRDVEIDYTDIEFGQVDLVSGNANRTWDRARTQTLTTAVGASYHMGFTPALNGYAGVDLLTSASRNLFEDIPVSSNNSNYTSGFETSYRVRLGGSYDLNGVTADFEVSGNHIAGASVAGGVTWTF